MKSTFFLTLLLSVGLFFFIRASVKDRTEQRKFRIDAPADSLLSRLEAYFQERAYQISAVDPQQQQIAFEGFVSPSWPLAIFLTVLAGLGLLSLGLVLSFLYPPLTALFLALVLLAPAAGAFYWKKAGRVEQVRLKVDTLPPPQSLTVMTITAHRDELVQLERAFPELTLP